MVPEPQSCIASDETVQLRMTWAGRGSPDSMIGLSQNQLNEYAHKSDDQGVAEAKGVTEVHKNAATRPTTYIYNIMFVSPFPFRVYISTSFSYSYITFILIHA